MLDLKEALEEESLSKVAEVLEVLMERRRNFLLDLEGNQEEKNEEDDAEGNVEEVIDLGYSSLPWGIKEGQWNSRNITSGRGKRRVEIAHIWHTKDIDGRGPANLRLLLSAPKMLTALMRARDADDYFREHGLSMMPEDVRLEIDEAIASALLQPGEITRAVKNLKKEFKEKKAADDERNR